MKISHARRLRPGAAVVLGLSLLFLSVQGAAADEAAMLARLPASTSAHAAKAPMLDVTKCGDRLVAVGIRGLIVVSHDEGVTWEQRPSPIDVTLTSLVCVGSNMVFAVGHEETLLRSADDGLTWRLVRTDAAGVPLLRIRFLDEKNGFAVGGRGVILRTTDGGASWARSVVSTDDGFDPHLFDIALLADRRLLLAGEAGRLFRSSDDGGSWLELKSPYVGSFFGLVGLGSASVLAYGMLGHAFLSTNGGDTWGELSTGESQSFFSAALTKDSIYLAGADGAIVTTPRNYPGVFTLNALQDRPNISGLVATPNGWVLASDRGLRHVATFSTNLSSH